MHRFRYIVVILGLGGYYIATGEWLAWILLITAAALPWLSLMLSLPAIRSFRVSAAGVPVCEVGEESKLWLLGSCPMPMPPFRGCIRLRCCFSGEIRRYRAEEGIPTSHCGGFWAEPEKVRVFDYLGLFSFRAVPEAPTQICVHPKPVPISDLPEPNPNSALQWKPKYGGGFSENHDLRPYRPGDNLSGIHWKLTAKRKEPIYREPLEPVQGQAFVTMTLSGTREELDRKLGRLLWLGGFLLEKKQIFSLRVLTGEGIIPFAILSRADLLHAMDTLLCSRAAVRGSIREQIFPAQWQYHIGGQEDEA